MQHIGTFQSKRWGKLNVLRGTYERADGPVAIVLQAPDGEPVATLSVNMYLPDCSHDSRALPKDCFYVKTWGGLEDLAAEALASGLFVQREDLPAASSGFVEAPAWQVTV